jgi:hypothetical protein
MSVIGETASSRPVWTRKRPSRGHVVLPALAGYRAFALLSALAIAATLLVSISYRVTVTDLIDLEGLSPLGTEQVDE